jgi:hypothetical protein
MQNRAVSAQETQPVHRLLPSNTKQTRVDRRMFPPPRHSHQNTPQLNAVTEQLQDHLLKFQSEFRLRTSDTKIPNCEKAICDSWVEGLLCGSVANGVRRQMFPRELFTAVPLS